MPDFQTAVIRVMVFGTLILVIGATGLYFVFRAFGEENDSRRNLLMIGLILFIATTCVLMYIVTR
jgi:high-affinity Fe2+/Pb2+ permease